jgi:hypothetical protein
MRVKIASTLLSAFIALSLLLGCEQDTPTLFTSCPTGSEAREVEVWQDQAVLVPRNPSKELLSSALWQGITPTMSRAEVEAIMAAYLRSRESYWSEFATPLGRLRWSLDREVSGGDEAKIPRIYLYPRKLVLADVLATDVVQCLQVAAPKVRYVIVMSSADSQRATLVVEGLTIKRVIWQQARM